MAALDHTYSAADLPQSENNFDPLPPGWYQGGIKSAELKTTKDGSGKYIAVRYDITGPTHSGRVVFGNINIRNKSEKAEEIGRQQLGDLIRAIGLPTISDTDQLIGGNVSIKLAIREQEGYEPTNEIKAYKATDGSKAPAISAPQAASASNGKAAPPWAKK